VNSDARNQLVEDNLALIGYQVSQMITRVPSHVRREDLASAGAVALVQASRAFEPARGVPFARYASIRIRGALVDELRSADWMSRGGRQKARRLDELSGQLASRLGRVPDDEELAQAMGMDAAGVREVRANASVRTVSLDADPMLVEYVESGGPLPGDGLLLREQLAVMRVAVDALPERLRAVVDGLFFHDATPAELAVELGVSQSRVSQLRSQALEMLRGAMETALETEGAPTPSTQNPGVAERRRLAYYSTVASRAAASDGRLIRDASPDSVKMA